MFSFFKREKAAPAISGEPRSVQPRKRNAADSSRSNRFGGRRRHRSSDILSMVSPPRPTNGQPSPPPKSAAIDSSYASVDATAAAPSSQRFIREVIVERRLTDSVFNIQIDSAAVQNEQLPKLLVKGPGFLSDDRLVSLNGRTMSPSMQADQVNRIIRSLAGKTLSVQVLSVVSTLIALDNNPTRPIKRFGTIRGSNEVGGGGLKPNQLTNLYWLVNETQIPSYSLVQLHRETNNSTAIVSRLTMPGQVFEAGLDKFEKANYPEFDMSDQLSSLQFINETALVHVLRTRLSSGYPFTSIGPLTVALPWTGIELFSILDEIKVLRDDLRPPHIVSSCLKLFRAAIGSSGGEHSLCLVGQAEILKRNLTNSALFTLVKLGCPGKSNIGPILDAYTQLINLISSCCSHSGQNPFQQIHQHCALVHSLDLNTHGHFAALRTQTFLSDRSPLFYHRRGASVFGLLCAIAHCDDPRVREQYRLDQAIKPRGSKHIFLNSSDNPRCTDLWHRFSSAVELIQLPADSIDLILSLGSAILHLGSCDASKLSGISLARAQTQCRSLPAFNEAAHLLGVDSNSLVSSVFNFDDDGQGDITPLKCICGFASALYDLVISHAQSAFAQAISEILSPGKSRIRSTLHLMNAPTVVGSAKRSCFPQLINNYFSERLHSLLSSLSHSAVLSNFQKEFPGRAIDRRNRSFRQMGQIMENLGSVDRMKEIGIHGLIHLLDHQFLTPEDIISTICSSSQVVNQTKLTDQTPTLSVVARPSVFRLNHFGGHLPVTYDPADWFAVYRELPRPSLLISLLESSIRPSFQNGFNQPPPRKTSTAAKLLHEMDFLASLLKQSKSLETVYCLSPNDQIPLTNNTFEDPSIRRQLRMFELVEVCRIFKSMLSQFVPHQTILNDFGPHLMTNRSRLQTALACANKQEAAQIVMDDFKIGNQSYVCGANGVYLRFGSLQELEFKRNDKVALAVTALQAIMRGAIARKTFEKKKYQKLAITLIQRNGRIYLRIKQWNWWRLFNRLRAVAPVYSFENRIIELESELSSTKRSLSRAQEECENLRALNEELEQLVDRRQAAKFSMGNFVESSADLPDRPEELESLRGQVEDLKKLVANRQERIVELESAAGGSDDDDAVSELVQRLRELEKVHASTSNELFDLRFESESKSGRIRELEGVQSCHDEQVAGMEARIMELEKALEDRESALSRNNGQIPSRRDSCSSMSTLSTIDITDETLSKAKAKIRGLRSRVEDLEAELLEQNTSVQLHEQARSKAELQLQQERKKHSVELEKLEEEFDGLRANFQRRIKLEQSKLDEEVQTSSQLRKQLHSTELKISELRFSSQASPDPQLNSTVSSLKKRLLQYKALLNDAHLQLDQIRSEGRVGEDLAEVRLRLEDAEAEKSNLERARIALKSEVDDLSEELDGLRRERLKQDERLFVVQGQNSDLLTRLDSLEEENDDLRRRTSSLVDERSREQRRIDLLLRENEQLSSDRRRLQLSCEELEARIIEIESSRRSSGAGDDHRLIELENQATMDAMALQRLKNQVDRLKEQCEKHKNGELAVASKLQTLELELVQAENRVKRTGEDLNTANETISRLQNERSKLANNASSQELQLSHLQAKLKLANERIQLLQAALNTDASIDDDDDDEDDD